MAAKATPAGIASTTYAGSTSPAIRVHLRPPNAGQVRIRSPTLGYA